MRWRSPADRFAAQGIGEGTRVGILLPMFPETVIAVLALGRLRAVFTPMFRATRRPPSRRGCGRSRRPTSSRPTGSSGAARWSTLKADRRRGGRRRADGRARARRPAAGRRGACRRAVDDRRATAGRRTQPARPSAVAAPASAPTGAVDPETPYMVIYTSGTTGGPKGTVHVHGGFPIKAAQDLAHTFDLRAGDALFWFTDLGWMMGPWAISGALLLGARLVLFEGAPDYPGAGPAVAARRAAPGHAPGRQPDARPRAARPRRGAGARPRPVLAARPRLHRRALEPRPVVVVVPRRRRRAAADRELHGRHRGQRRDPRRRRRCARSGRRRSTGRVSGWRRTSSTRTGRPVRGPVGELAIRGPWPGMTRGFWGGRPTRALPGGYWRAARAPGSTATGRSSTPTASGTSTGGRTTRSRSPASAWVRPRSRRWRSPIPAVVEAAAIGVPDELKGEVLVVLVRRCGATSRDRRGPASREVDGAIVARLGQAAAGRRPWCVVADLPADAERQDHAAGGAGRLAGPGPGRPVRAGEPGGGRLRSPRPPAPPGLASRRHQRARLADLGRERPAEQPGDQPCGLEHAHRGRRRARTPPRRAGRPGPRWRGCPPRPGRTDSRRCRRSRRRRCGCRPSSAGRRRWRAPCPACRGSGGRSASTGIPASMARRGHVGDLRGHADPDRVAEADLVRAELEQAPRDLHRPRRIDPAAVGAAEGRRDVAAPPPAARAGLVEERARRPRATRRRSCRCCARRRRRWRP